MTGSTQNINSSQRFAIADILRAYALLGVAIINYTGFRDWDYTHGNTADFAFGLIATYIFFRKSALLLSVLFGYGFAVLVNNLKKKNANTVSFFTKRMFWLFVIAFINSCFYDGDILKTYAVIGMLLLLFYKSSTKTILTGAVALLLLIPFSFGFTMFGMHSDPIQMNDNLFLSHHLVDIVKYNLGHSYLWQITSPFYAIAVQHITFCCFLWGMYIQRIRFVENIHTKQAAIKRLFWFSIPAFALSTYLTYLTSQVNFLKLYCNFLLITYLCSVVFFSSAIMWLYINGKCKIVFKAMELYGKMTLTNYIMQNIISFFVFSGIGLSIVNSKPYSFYFMLAIVVYVVQIFISKYWLSKFNYGPVEWVWRKLSAQTTLPFGKSAIVNADYLNQNK